jgi:hypothetical protein
MMMMMMTIMKTMMMMIVLIIIQISIIILIVLIMILQASIIVLIMHSRTTTSFIQGAMSIIEICETTTDSEYGLPQFGKFGKNVTCISFRVNGGRQAKFGIVRTLSWKNGNWHTTSRA